MRRRHFIGLIGGAAAALPVAAVRGQQPGKLWRIGFLTVQSAATFSGLHGGFLQGMRELGYIDGRDFVSDWRTTDGPHERLLNLAAELVEQRFDVLISGVSAAVQALQQS